ncbi:MAG: hypothetical protein CMF04_08005, partial [Hyphomonas sp.]|nr:hypothetical protein [Hyphomonas sp.]
MLFLVTPEFAEQISGAQSGAANANWVRDKSFGSSGMTASATYPTKNHPQPAANTDPKINFSDTLRTR